MTEKTSRERAILQWLADGETGISSEVLALASVGIIGKQWGSCPPGDGNDCGRCEALARRCPFVVDALPGLIEREPRWARWEARIREAARVH